MCDTMDNKNLIIIILVCVLVALSALVAFTMMPNQTQPTQNITSTNTTTDAVVADTISPEEKSSSGGTHTEHLIGGDVEVDENGMVVGSYNSKGEYFPGGQMGGMTIEEARAFDERASKYGLT